MWDIFISHASEDKAYVEPLVQALEEAGVSVWYDRLVLEWGEPLRSRIDEGLLSCRFGIVILSKAFLKKKKWTDHELNGLFAREEAGVRRILPIWHGITREDILAYSPALADRLAKASDNETAESIVQAVLRALGNSRKQVPSRDRSPSSFTVIQFELPALDKYRRAEHRSVANKRHFELFSNKNLVATIDAGIDKLARPIPIPVGEHALFVEYDVHLPRYFSHDNRTVTEVRGWKAKGRTEVQLIELIEPLYIIELVAIEPKMGFWESFKNEDIVASYRLQIRKGSIK